MARVRERIPDTFVPDPPDDELLRRVGLTRHEYERAVGLLGRKPNLVELGMIGALWSEHCGYKSSRLYLRELPTEAPWVLQGPGENAGIVELTEELAVVFKIESHNHPSAIEPFQGAATGIGGIIRDIFAMGARPIALLDSLRFGEIRPGKVNEEVRRRNLYQLHGVVAGIAHYGNCVGIPTVGGELMTDPAYNTTPLVNCMCVGLVRKERMVRARASGVGNPVFLVGARTGPDGVQGATFASAELTERSEEDRPAVQVGDPFLEKLLLEATLELAGHPAVVGIQDLGAAGLTSSTAETAARGGVGMELNLDAVPKRSAELSAYEMMLSESQERMLIIVRAGNEEEVLRVFRKWDLDAALVGRVIEEPVLRVFHRGEVVAELPVGLLTEEAPLYTPDYCRPREPYRPAGAGQPLCRDEVEATLAKRFGSPAAALREALAHPTVGSKLPVWRQYDHMVRIGTVAGPGGDAAVIRVVGERVGLALTTDGTARWVYLSPHRGAAKLVLEAALNLLSVGAEPLAITNCLNFASPEDLQVMDCFARAVEGMGEALREIGVPVVSGNVSFYNEGPLGKVLPTPVIGMVGKVEDVSRAVGMGLPGPGLELFLLGSSDLRLDGSLIAFDLTEIRAGEVEPPDYPAFRRLRELLSRAHREGLMAAAHDISDGGLAVTLAEMCITGSTGAEVTLPEGPGAFARLFSEAGQRVVVAVPAEGADRLSALAEDNGVACLRIGRSGGGRLIVRGESGQEWIDMSVEELAALHRGGVERWM